MLDPILNQILKEMWRLDEKLVNSINFTVEEEGFYKKHINTIKNYYSEQSNYWKDK